MPEQLHVAIDLDDVVLAFTEGVIDAVEREYGVRVEPFTTWDMSLTLDPVIGQHWWEWLRKRDWLWSHFGPIKGAIGGITKLREQGHLLEIVTSKPDWAEYSVWRWMGKWRPPVQSVTIVGMDQRKFEETSADVLIDDKPSSVVEFVEDGRTGLLFDRPHNRADGDHPGVIRCHGWDSVVRTVELRAEGLL